MPAIRNLVFQNENKDLAQKFKIQESCKFHFIHSVIGKQQHFIMKQKTHCTLKSSLDTRNWTQLYYILKSKKTLYKEKTDAFTVKVAKNKDEITDLLATGFDYICEKDGLAFFRKHK